MTPLSDYTSTARDALFAVAKLGGAADAPEPACPTIGVVVGEVASARGADMSQQRISDRLRVLRDDGLVTTRPDPSDGRAALYQLTEDGAGVLDRQVEYQRRALDGADARPLDIQIRRYLHDVAGRDAKTTTASSEIADRLGVSVQSVSGTVEDIAGDDRRLELTDVSRSPHTTRWEVRR